MVRAITHIHTRYSWDGIFRPVRLVDSLVEHGIGVALVSDHDSFVGSLECRRYVSERGLALDIPVAAEIRTDRGDVIVIFEDESDLPEIATLKQWDKLPEATTSRGGLIWLPHPYQSHDFIEELAETSDVVEVFNGRCSEEQNRQAVLLAARHDCVPAYGADVHRPSEVGQCVVDYPAKNSVLETLRQTPVPIRAERTRRSRIMAAEFTHGIKQRRPALAAYMGLRWMQHRRREAQGVRR